MGGICVNAGNITTTKDTTTVGSATSNSLLRTGHCMTERRKDGGMKVLYECLV
jgi:hypothetical protein